MTTLPASGYLSDNARTEGQMKSALEAVRDVIAENLPGAYLATATGTANALAADFDPDLTLADEPLVRVVAAAANSSTTPTLATDGTTARTITRFGNQPLLAGDIFGAGHVLFLQYVAAGPRWELLNPASDRPRASTTEALTGTDAVKALTADAVAALWEKGSDIASGGTISIGEGGFFHITGTTGITDIDFATDKTGRGAWIVFDGALTLTHSSTLILPTGANITTAAGDVAYIVSEGSDAVRVLAYLPKSGLPVASLAALAAGISDLTQDTSVAWLTDWLLAETSDGVRKVSPKDVISNKPRFSVTKGGTDQTGIVPSTDTKLTWPTELFDVGGYFASNAWTPPAGYVQLTAMAALTGGIVDQNTFSLYIFKNGSVFRTINQALSGTGTHSAAISILDLANGTDFYEVWVKISGTGNKTISGAAGFTNFMGLAI